MSEIGIIRVVLFFVMCSSLFACVCLLLYRKRKWGVVAGWIAIPALILFIVLGPSIRGMKSPEALAHKASEKIAECQAIGDRPITRSEKILVWDLEDGRFDPAQEVTTDWLDEFWWENPGDAPVTVFLVSGKRSELVGNYETSGQPAYREWIEIYVVQFRNLRDAGTALAMHKIVSLDPRRTRIVKNSPEYGTFTPDENEQPFASDLHVTLPDWIRSLPTG